MSSRWFKSRKQLTGFRLITLITSILTCLALLGQTPNVLELPPKENRWALVIGVSNYDDRSFEPLAGDQDAKIIAKALVKHLKHGATECQISEKHDRHYSGIVACRDKMLILRPDLRFLTKDSMRQRPTKAVAINSCARNSMYKSEPIPLGASGERICNHESHVDSPTESAGLENYTFLTLKTHLREPCVFGRKHTQDFAGFSNAAILAVSQPSRG